MAETAQRLSANLVGFCTFLREEYDFALGRAEAHDALRALEAVGVGDRERVRTALRLVCSSTPVEFAAFDRAFEAFFAPEPLGVPQPDYHPRHTRPGRTPAGERIATTARADERSDDEGVDAGGSPERRPVDDDDADAMVGPALVRARYSAQGASSESEPLPVDVDTRLLCAANRLIATVHLGRSRRWRAMRRGERFDVRRMMRSSLQTGGEPLDLRYRGHPHRNPRFLLLIDGSRSVAQEAHLMLQFARAMCASSSRVSVFVFSTALREVTREIRAAIPRGGALTDLGEAWGGGTRIGSSLATLIDHDGARVLTPETLVFIFSDGLDVGEPDRLARAIREIDRRSAGIVWINPHADADGYAPSARGMRAAMPHVIALCGAKDARGYEAMAGEVGRSHRIRGRRS